MAKKKAPSIHSRAARRATSPSIDTDRSLKDIKPPSRTASQRRSVLAAQHSAGVTKKSKRGRKDNMSAKAKRRHEKGLEMAEAVSERTKSKVEKSIGRGKNVQQRSKAWDDINKAAEIKGQDDSETEVKGAQEWDADEDMEVADDQTIIPAPVTTIDESTEAMVAAAAAQPLPADDDGDEIL
ncbi:hypothetical protein FALBO_2416 [Fusarium albosuccineum]|uniref:Microfibril-associated protein n=1 Tax=Fusarium albosuccineum TaxID=1237068 RepID=A0A8H4PGV4_9HYPO|nr:hypothetical protein FALBO_2416 [Fusarium albosuccineum]